MGWRIVVGCHGFVYGNLGGRWRLLAVSRHAGFIYDARKGRKMSCVRVECLAIGGYDAIVSLRGFGRFA